MGSMWQKHIPGTHFNFILIWKIYEQFVFLRLAIKCLLRTVSKNTSFLAAASVPSKNMYE